MERLKQTIAPAVTRLSLSWSDCKNVLWNTRNVTYILCLLTVILMISLILSWNKNFIVFIAGTCTLFATYGTLVVSKQSCFSVLDNSIAAAMNARVNE